MRSRSSPPPSRFPSPPTRPRAAVAAAALAAGARIINDVSGLRADPAMADIAAQGEGVVLMAAPDGGPADSPLAEIRRLLSDSLARAARRDGPGEIVLDPGIGFFLPADGVARWSDAAGRDRRARHADDLGCRSGRSSRKGSRSSHNAAAASDRLSGSLAALQSPSTMVPQSFAPTMSPPHATPCASRSAPPKERAEVLTC
jgi:dihydropteroate synthase